MALAALAAAMLRGRLGSLAPTLAVTPAIALIGVGLMLALGFTAGIIPAVNAMRLNIARALKRA